VLTSDETDSAGDPAQQWTYTYFQDGDKKSAAQYVNATTTLTTSWTYDERGSVLSVTDPKQLTTSYTYNEVGQLADTVAPSITVTDPTTGSTSTVAPTTVTGYDTFGDPTQSEDANGDITVTGYDLDGRKTATTLPSYTPHGSSTAISATTAWTLDADGNVTKEVDADGNETDYTYDQLDDQLTKTDPAIDLSGTMTQGTWTYSYDLAGDQLTQDSPYGSLTHESYDDLGRAHSTWAYVYLTTSAESEVGTTTAYNPAGETASTVSTSGVTTSYTYDDLGQVKTQADTSLDTTQYSYDLNGDTTETILPDESIQKASYDAAGRETGSTDESPTGAVLRSTSATYDGDGNLLTSTNALQVTESYTYDADGNLIKQVEPTSATHSITTSYGYDADGNRTAYTDGNGNTSYSSYTPWGLPESTKAPATSAYTTAADSTSYVAYDGDGDTVDEYLPGGATITNTYDALGDLTGQSGTGADAATATRSFGYSLNQHLISSTVGGSTEDYDTNSLGELLTETGQAGSSSFTYNADGSPLTSTDASGTSTYSYDTDGRPVTDTDASTGTTLSYTYNQLSQPSTITYGTGGDSQNLTYDPLHRLSTDTLTTPGGSTVASVGYTYNNGDELTGQTTTGVVGAGSNSYQYDQAGRLTSWTTTPTSTGTSATTGYTYDDDGNRLTAGSTTYRYDARDELTSDGTATYSYTARGTLSGKTVTATNSTMAYSFDAYGQEATAGATSYTYDALGRDITSGSTTLAYSGEGNDVASDGTTTYSRDASGNITGENTPGTGATLTLTNAHTDIIGQFTATGATLTGSAGYDPWGNPVGTSTLTGTLGYQSEYTDPATSQVNMDARWYQPGTGSFNSADTMSNSPVGSSVNANQYTYGNDNPAWNTDPSGHFVPSTQWLEETEAANSVDDGDPVGWGTSLALAGIWGAYQIWGGGGSSSSSHRASSRAAADEDTGGCTSGLECETEAEAQTCTSGLECEAQAADEAAYLDSLPDAGSSTGSGGGSGGGGGGGGGWTGPTAAQLAAEAAAAAAAIRARAVRLTASIGHSTLTVHSAAVAASPSARINTELSLITAGSTQTFTSSDEQTDDIDCPTNGSVSYGLRDAENGNRATGVEACITPAMLGTGSGAKTKGVPGYRWAQSYATALGVSSAQFSVNACHLLGDQLGGKGVLANEATCGRSTNAARQDPTDPGRDGPMVAFENVVYAEVESGAHVLYTVRPEYLGNRTVPYAFVMEAASSVGGAQVDIVPNVIYSPNQSKWVNIGLSSCSSCANALPTPGVK